MNDTSADFSQRVLVISRGPSIPVKQLVVGSLTFDLRDNDRTQLSDHCPLLRTANKVTPYRIPKISFDSSYNFRIGITQYRFGTYRQYDSGVEIPPEAQKENDKGGVQYDLDKYGIRENESEDFTTPGDLKIGNGRLLYLEHSERQIRSDAGSMKQILDSKLAIGVIAPHEHKAEIQKINYTLLPYDYRRNQKLPPFQTFIQLTIKTDGQEKEKIERFEYEEKGYLREAAKYFWKKIFGRRKMPVTVGRFEMNTKDLIIRFPLGFELKTRKILLHGDAFNVLAKLEPIISNPYSLDTVEIYSTQGNLAEFQHKIVHNAKKVSLNGITSNHRELQNHRWLPILQTLWNPRISLRNE